MAQPYTQLKPMLFDQSTFNARKTQSFIASHPDMDTAAYLTKHGWLGPGHSLHPNGHGIKKPIHITEKLDVLGVGKKKHEIHADQWWARMFDSTLKDLQIGENQFLENPEASSATSTGQNFDDLPRQQPNIIQTSSLYRNFVKGESLVGTIEAEVVKQLQTESSLESQRKEKIDLRAKSRRSRKIEESKAEKFLRNSLSPSHKEQKEAQRLQRMKRRENAKDDRSRRKANKKL